MALLSIIITKILLYGLKEGRSFAAAQGMEMELHAVEQAGIQADGQAQGQPNDEEDGPCSQEDEGVGQHGGGDGTDTGLLVILLSEDDDNGVVGHHGSDDVGAAVTDTVGQLAQLGAVAQQHEHGNEHGSQNVPLGGSGTHEQVHEGREQNEDDAQTRITIATTDAIRHTVTM